MEDEEWPEDPEDWPEQFRVELPSGKCIELDEETTRQLYVIALRDGITPPQALSTLITAESLLVQATTPMTEAFIERLLRKK